jgi:DNA-binding PadR family transcriptional regulator
VNQLYFTKDTIDEKDSMLLRLIPATKEDGIGLLELLNKTKRKTLRHLRIGSQHTLESRLSKLQALGLIGKDEGRHVGRGHKSGYHLTVNGKLLLEHRRLQPEEVSFEAPEIVLLKSLSYTASEDRQIIIFSDPPLSSLVSSERKSELLEKVDREASDSMRELEDTFTSAHEMGESFLKSNKWTGDEEAILDVLQRRYTLQQRRGIRPYGGRYPTEVMQVVRTLNEKNARLPLEEREKPFTPDTLRFDIVGKRLDNVPLSKPEFRRYRKLLGLEKKYEKAWAAMEAPSIALLICNKRYVDELQIRAYLVKTGDDRYEITEAFLKRLPSRDLLACEREFWEAANTDKYVKDLTLSECNEKGCVMGGKGGPTPGQTVGLRYPLQASPLAFFGFGNKGEAWDIDIQLTIRRRKEYFARMHRAIAEEVKARKLPELPHNSKATYKDVIESRRRELEDYYGPISEPKVKDEGLRIDVYFIIPGLRPLKLVPPPFARRKQD